MSTPRIPPVPPNKGGELDKTAPSTEHRKVEKVEKISKVSEVDDESRAKQFRHFVESVTQDEESELPTPFSLIAKSPVSSESVLPPSQDPALLDEGENALPSPGSSFPTPSNYLGGTAAQDESEEAPPLPRSQQFWENVEEPPPSQPPMQPHMEENPRSASRVFLKPEEMGRKGKMPSTGGVGEETPLKGKKGSLREPAKKTPSPFGPPGKPTIEGHAPRERDAEFEKRWGLSQEKRKRSAGPEGVIEPQDGEGIKYIGPLAAGEKAEDGGPLPGDRIGAQLAPALREERPKFEKKEAPPSIQEPEK